MLAGQAAGWPAALFSGQYWRAADMWINFTALATGALSFTIALAWNDAASKAIQSLIPPTNKQAALRAAFVYALVVTLIVVVLVAVANHTKTIVNRYTVKGLSAGKRGSPENRGRSAGCPNCGSVPSIVRP